MKKSIIIFASLLCAGCAQPPLQPVAQCPSAGIDIQHPNFHQDHDGEQVDNFFRCSESQARTIAHNQYARRNILERMGGEAAYQQAADREVASLEYQRILWKQVLNGEKSPDAAYEAWMKYVQNERMIDAANASAAAANRAAAAASEAAMWWHY